MAIASTAIAVAPIAGLKSGRVAAQCLSPWGNATATNALVQAYSIRMAVECVQRYETPRTTAQLEQSYGAAMARTCVEHWWDSCIIVKTALAEEYGHLFVRASAPFPYGNAPIQAQNDQPIHFTVATALESAWNLRENVRSQCAMPWGFTNPVAIQGVFRWDRLVHDPVTASLSQIWNLADDRAIRLHGTTVRAFHFGEIV